MASVRVLDKTFEPFLGAIQIDTAIKRLADEINNDYAGRKPLFIAILNGSFMFAADLFKAITIEAEICFIKLASYKGTKSTGQVITAIGLDIDIHERHLIILEDIVDTGKTLSQFLPQLQHQHPASLELVVLLHKPELMCEGFVSTGDGHWRKLETDSVTAIAPWGEDGFLLGRFDGEIDVLDRTQTITSRHTIGRAKGRLARLVTVADRAIGIVGQRLLGARLLSTPADDGDVTTERWSLPLTRFLRIDATCALDVDTWSAEPQLAVLGDDAILVVDAKTGAIRERCATTDVRMLRWIGPGRLLAVEVDETAHAATSRMRVLDTSTGRWTPSIDAADVTRIAVRGDEIHVGYVDQSVGVWNRLAVARRVGLETVGRGV